MGDSPIGTTKNIVIPLGTVYANRTTWVRAESAKKSCKKRVFSPSILIVHLIHVGNEVQQLVGIAPLVVLSLSVKFPFKHLKTRYVRYNSHIIWDKVYSQDISQILSCFPRFIILGILTKS